MFDEFDEFDEFGGFEGLRIKLLIFSRFALHPSPLERISYTEAQVKIITPIEITVTHNPF